MSQTQTHAATILAQQIRRRMKSYVFPPEILENLTDQELLELRAMSRSARKEKTHSYANVRQEAVDFIRERKKSKPNS